MFKPVTDTSGYDAETVELYKKRDNDPRLSYVLAAIPRRERHNLPVVVDAENNEYLQKLERQ